MQSQPPNSRLDKSHCVCVCALSSPCILYMWKKGLTLHIYEGEDAKSTAYVILLMSKMQSSLLTARVDGLVLFLGAFIKFAHNLVHVNLQ